MRENKPNHIISKIIDYIIVLLLPKREDDSVVYSYPRGEEGEPLYAGFKRRMNAATFDMLVILVLILLVSGTDTILNKEVALAISEAQTRSDGTPPKSGEEAYRNMMGISKEEQIKLLQVIIPQLIANTLWQIIIVACFLIPMWHLYGATPGKMLTAMRVVDAKTLKRPGLFKCILRFIGYIVSSLLFFVGFLTIGMHKQKRGWHDIMSGTMVIHTRDLNTQEEKDRRFKRDTILVLAFFFFGTIFLLIKG